jgi:hypothetical protein
MKPKIALQIILIISLIGIIFSGYLSYSEIFSKTCPLGNCTNVSGIPACVYGLVMYLIVFIITIFGLKGKE